MGVRVPAIKGAKHMHHSDFGRFDGPLVLFGGPYSNFQALQAFSEALAGRPAICTGDLVAYCASPIETVDLLRSLDVSTIAGNCERQVADGALDCGCGFEDGTACDLLSKGWYSYLSKTIDAASVSYLASLPEIGSFTHQDRRYAVIHGGATAINRFIWPDCPDSVFQEEISAIEAAVGKVDGVVAGHSGIALHRRIGHHQWINAGVIGLPTHDGRPETRYAVLEDGEVIIERLTYDNSAARQAMEAVGLMQGYHETMTTGIWPSEDVLPASLHHE